jgi:hypothetical protein
MSIPGSGAVNFSDISNILGGGRPVSLSEYYRDANPLYSYHISSLPNMGSALSVSTFRNGTRNSNMFSSVSATNNNYYLGGVYFQVTAKNNIVIDRITPTFYANNGTVTLSSTIFFRKGPLTDANVLTDSAQWSNAGTSSSFSFSDQSNIQIPTSIGLSLNSNEVGSIYFACGPNTIAGGPLGYWTNGLPTGGTTVDGTDLILQRGGYHGNGSTLSTFPINGNTGVDFCGSILYVKPPLYTFTAHTFTNASATGRTGPSLAQCKTSYSTSWVNDTALFNITTQGIQIWTVPIKGNYRFVVAGAASGSFYNGNANGVVMTIANFNLNIGDKLYIVVGQMGLTGGGGGASWVFLNNLSSASLIFVAGGAGGAGYNGYFGLPAPNPYGTAGQLSTAATYGYGNSYNGGLPGTSRGGGGGTQGFAGSGTAGGSDGSGGNAPTSGNINMGAGGGGGSGNITASSTFLGGTGNGPGGFGGGGGSSGSGTGWGLGGGGGGGYNGGGAGSGASDNNAGGGGGGGGGSYYISSNGVFSSWSATNNGVGYVTVTKE